MREVDASWKRAIEVVEQLEKLARELNQKHVLIAAEHLKLDDYTAEIKEIIRIRKDAALQATDVDCTVGDMECNADQIEGLLDDVYSELNNLKENIRQITKGDV